MHIGVLCLILLCARALRIQSEELNLRQCPGQECLPIQRQASSPFCLLLVRARPAFNYLKTKVSGEGSKASEVLRGLEMT